MRRARPVFLLSTLALVIAALALSTACRKEPQGRCGRLIADLQSPAKAKEAIRLLGERHGGKSCAKGIPQLKKMFEEGRYRAEILRSVKHMGKDEVVQIPEYKPLLQAALKNQETAAIGASVIEDWKLAEMKDDLVSMLTDKDSDPKAAGAALNALLSFAPANEIEDILITLAERDPDKQGLRVNVVATEKLSEIRSARALPAIVKTLFLKTQRGEEMYQAARLALVRVNGKPTRDLLVATLEARNEELRSWARANGIPDWEWQDGPKVVQLIGDMADPDAAPAVAANMTKKLVEPAGITDQALEQWRIANSNRITINMLTLARIGDDRVVPVLQPLVADAMADFKQRMDSASALAAIGSPAAVDALFKVYEESGDERFKAPFLRPLTAALDFAHLAKYDELIAKDEKDGRELITDRTKSDPMVIASVALVRECQEDTACYLKYLKPVPNPADAPQVAPPTDGSEPEEPPYTAEDIAQAKQWKATLMLSRAKDNAATVIPALLEAFAAAPASATDIRNYTLIALERLGRDDQKVYDGLAGIAKAEKEKAGFGFWSIELDARVSSYRARKDGEPKGQLPEGVISAPTAMAPEGGAPAPDAPQP
jgi:hypothetical protein